MRKILIDFKKIKKEQKALGDYPALAYAVGENPNATKDEILVWFDDLVSKDQYRRAEKDVLLNYLYNISKMRQKTLIV